MGSAVARAQATKIRLYHLTFYKCGSQWVRDILSDPRIAELSEHTLAATGVDVLANSWPELTPGQIASPVYTSGNVRWMEMAGPEDRAFVVIRDPRDIVVSLTYSLSYSHTPGPITQLLRGPVAEATPEHRLQVGMFLLAQWSDYLASWVNGGQLPNIRLAKYEDLLADLPGQLTELFDFLQWPVSPEVIAAVAADNTFESRTGRRPGEENEFSHRRKGIAGDWRNHFNRELGQLFEDAFPRLLYGLGYEAGDDWWQSLPAAIDRPIAPHIAERARLLKILEEHESELTVVRQAAEERLRDVHTLHEMLAEANARSELAQMNPCSTTEQESLAALALHVKEVVEHQQSGQQAVREKLKHFQEAEHADRLTLINQLTSEVASLHQQLDTLRHAADERLEGLLREDNHRRDLESSLAWRFGFRPLRALFSLIRR